MPEHDRWMERCRFARARRPLRSATSKSTQLTRPLRRNERKPIFRFAPKGRLFFLVAEAIADAADGFENIFFTFGDFLAQILDMDVNDIGEGGIIEIPQMAQELLTVDDLVWVAHKILQKPEFFEGELNQFAASLHRALRRI